MIEELLERLRGIADNPGRAIAPLWVLFWLWSVARNWIRRFRAAREQEPATAAEPEPATAAETLPRPPARTAQPSAPRARAVEAPAPAPARKAESRWPALIERAETLRSRLLFERSLRWLEPILVREVIAPLHAASARSRAADVTTEVERRAAGAVLTLQALEHVVRERSGDTAADVEALFEIDRIAQATQRPLAEYARAEDIALLGRTPLAVHFEANPSHYARGLTAELLFLSVPRGAGARLSDYTTALQALGRRWFFAFPKLAEQLRDELGLSDRARLVDPRDGFDEQSAYAAFGPWLPALFAEVALGLRLGHGYVTALRHQVVAAGPAATHARAHGEYLGSEPPPLLRMHAARVALDEGLSRHEEAKRHRAALAEALPDATEILLPLADGRSVALPAAFMVQLTEEVSRAVLETRIDALGGVPLAQWPGFPQTLEDAREQVALSREPLHGAPRSADAARLLGAAWLAADHGGDPEAALGRLRRALSPRAEPTALKEAAPSARRPRSLHDAFRDPRTLRNAILIGAAFSPPRSAPRRRS